MHDPSSDQILQASSSLYGTASLLPLDGVDVAGHGVLVVTYRCLLLGAFFFLVVVVGVKFDDLCFFFGFFHLLVLGWIGSMFY